MHNIVKTIIIISIGLLLAGCKLNNVSVDIERDDHENEDEIVNIEIPKINGLTDKEFEEEINTFYTDSIKNELEIFSDESEKNKKERPDKSKFQVKQNVAYNKKSLLSIVSEYYKYTCGINGVNYRNVINIDTSQNIKLELKDIFVDDEYKQMLDSKLEKLSKEDIYSDLWEKPVIGDMQNEYFYFSDSGLVIFYPPYELSYYSRGFVEFTIPYRELYGYLRPEYTSLYG